ncbi:class 3 adenylate cyclase [Sinorhizobium kostiense]|uniref:Class 3 adenylate cyclase n=1 Tax=Sinorhizobium kostiense TaxID=76747 RepID=A0ABS4QX84_9HYPH|nr:adenylate/guanylate cyclase domain-containing protein [Sinorhizobium kostiense]MBP2235263.1 class 3 adenylate cyclase [Sinorhizobium kostiense]
MAERKAAVPASDRIEVRIGVNLGEVIVEGDDRYGEGVNIATRLEQVAEPGSVYVSEKVAREVERSSGSVRSTSRISPSPSLSIG